MTDIHCTDCGEQLVPGKPFCANCGAAVGQQLPDAPMDSTQVADSPTKSRKWLWWMVGAVLVLALVGGGVGATVMAQNRAAEQAAQKSAAERASRLAAMKKAYEAVVVVQSATQVGVNYQDYGSRVRDAAAAIAVFEPSDPDGTAVRDDLNEAMDCYTTANGAWGTKFDEYESLAYSDFQKSHPELDSALFADDAIQLMWQQADVAMLAAKSKLAAYEGKAQQ